MSNHRSADGPEQPIPRPTADQLRTEIDSGQTHDKVAHADPAMAPLGTDDEASGAPPTAEQVETARSHETSRQVADPALADRPAGEAGGSWMVWLIGGAVVIAALVAIAFAL